VIVNKLKFAVIYTLVLPVPLLLVLIPAAVETHDIPGFIAAFSTGAGWLFWPLAMVWPWLPVTLEAIRSKRRERDSA